MFAGMLNALLWDNFFLYQMDHIVSKIFINEMNIGILLKFTEQATV